MPTKIIVTADDRHERIDAFLARRPLGLSRTRLQRLIADGYITVNGKTVSPHAAIRVGDAIVITDQSRAGRSTELVRDPAIVFENEAILVLDKPAGLIVHGGASVRSATLADWLRQHRPATSRVGDHPEQRPGIVHRLDKDVSGLLIVAKTQLAFAHLKKQFQQRRVNKEYLALVHGRPSRTAMSVNAPIARSAGRHGRMIVGRGPDAREAITHLAVERTVGQMALLRVRIETGRTHQIRVHLKSIGHPIVGDRLYTTKPYRRLASELGRPFLHAERLSLTDPDGRIRSFTAPLAPELKKFLNEH